MIAVGLSGWKGSGKDTVAKFLIHDFGFKRISFADTLKDQAAIEFGVPREWMDDPEFKESPLSQFPVNPQDAFSRMIAESTIKSDFKPNADGVLCWTPRALCILKGSVMRSVDVNYWVRAAVAKADGADRIAITDLRYNSEVAGLFEIFGSDLITVRVNRFDHSNSSDPSERDLDLFEFDHYIENKGTMEELVESVRSLFNKILK